MSVPVLEAIADAIYLYEGNKPRDRAYRNRNPGNLRATDAITPQDGQMYRIFPSFAQGYNALLYDLTCKISGMNKTGLDFDSSLLDLFNVYAPAADRNDPEKYADYVAFWLGWVYGVTSITPVRTFREIYAIAKEEVPRGVSAT
jgi:hypothetical protein